MTTGCALIPAGAPHALKAEGTPLVLMLVERHSTTGTVLEALARRAADADLSARLTGLEVPATPSPLSAWFDAVVAALGAPAVGRVLSSPTRRAVAYVEANLGGRPRLSTAADAAGLSPTRLTHVFSQEIGLPFRRFVLWARIKRAVTAAGRGRTLTEAATEAGFSDSAHFARTFRAMFGLAPSMVLSRAEIIGSAWQA